MTEALTKLLTACGEKSKWFNNSFEFAVGWMEVDVSG